MKDSEEFRGQMIVQLLKIEIAPAIVSLIPLGLVLSENILLFSQKIVH
jgi:hypothetical protein